MAQPTQYERQYNFSNYQSASPSSPLPAAQVDIELNAVKTSLDETQANLALIQRDDGALKNNSVGYDQLKAEVEIGVNPPTAWVTSTSYAERDTVTFGTGFYRCLEAHVSGTFATDLAAGKWELIVDFSTDISLAVIASALHAADAKTVLVDADEFYGLDSAATYATKRVTFLSLANSLWTKLGALIAGGTGKTTPVDADTIPLSDSAASDATKKLTWANLKATIFSSMGALITAATGKTTPVDADTLLLSDSAASDASKKLTWANLKAAMFTAIGPAIAAATGKTTPADGDTFLISDSAATDAGKKLTWANVKATLVATILTWTAKQTFQNAAFTTAAVDLTVGQIKFPATDNPSSDANTLDDYEEGTFTPTFSSSGATFSYASQYGKYTKIGNRVFASIRLELNTSGNTLTANPLSIAGLPFTSSESQIVSSPIRWGSSTSSYVNLVFGLTAGGTSGLVAGATAAATTLGGSVLSNAGLHATNGSAMSTSTHYTA